MEDLINRTMTTLAENNDAFCSEAHFQHELALRLAQTGSCKRIVLERSYPDNSFSSKDLYLDVWIKTMTGERIGIELKYKTADASFQIEGESVNLKNHMATDSGRYGFWEDVRRLELLIRDGKLESGYVVFLTNAPSYWEFGGQYKNGNITQDHNFNMVAGRSVGPTALLAWDLGTEKIGKLTAAGKKHWTVDSPVISLSGQYTVPVWRNYSKDGKFKYLLMRVLASSR